MGEGEGGGGCEKRAGCVFLGDNEGVVRVITVKGRRVCGFLSRGDQCTQEKLVQFNL